MTDIQDVKNALYNIEVAFKNINSKYSNSNQWKDNNTIYIYTDTNEDKINEEFKIALDKILNYTKISKKDLKFIINKEIENLKKEEYKTDLKQFTIVYSTIRDYEFILTFLN